MSGLPVNKPIEVRVITDGFQVWEQTVQLKDGDSIVLKPKLKLTDAMDYVPDAEAIQGTMNANAVSSIIRSRETAIQDCIVEHHPAEDRINRKLEIVSMYSRTDTSVAYPLRARTTVGGRRACIQRQLGLSDSR